MEGRKGRSRLLPISSETDDTTPLMFHKVLEKGRKWLYLVIAIVNGVYYGRDRHGWY